ncbi:MAG: twin-arginine translocation signal domain-containing protein [Isosphaeraceae bacterium]
MISAASRPRPELNRRHFLGHLTATALGVPALQFFSSLNANADQVRKNHRSCIVLWMSGGPSHLDI